MTTSGTGITVKGWRKEKREKENVRVIEFLIMTLKYEIEIVNL